MCAFRKWNALFHWLLVTGWHRKVQASVNYVSKLRSIILISENDRNRCERWGKITVCRRKISELDGNRKQYSGPEDRRIFQWLSVVVFQRKDLEIGRNAPKNPRTFQLVRFDMRSYVFVYQNVCFMNWNWEPFAGTLLKNRNFLF
jgi:hypothetical protein